MKILLLSSTNNVHNGYGNITHEYCLALKKKGVAFTLLLPVDEPRYEYTDYPVLYILPSYVFRIATLKFLPYIFFKFKTDADIIHCLFEFPYAFIARKIAYQNKIPFILGTQGTYGIQPLHFFPEKYLVKSIYNSAEEIVVPSVFTKTLLTYDSKTKTPIRIIHNPVNFERFQGFDKNEVEKIKNSFGGRKILLTVGGLKSRKGQDLVIRALAQLRKSNDVYHYVVIGGGEKKNALMQLAETLKISDRVSFLGEVDGQQLVNYFHASFLYVHTPIMNQWQFEGFGIVYLEASACKKPIVATDSGGIRDAVIDQQTGLVVSDGDVSGIAQAIDRFNSDQVLYDRVSRDGFIYAQRHDWNVLIQDFIAVYEKIITSK